MLKCLFIFVDQNETKLNVIALFCLVLSRYYYYFAVFLSHFRGCQGCQVFATITLTLTLTLTLTQLLLKTSPIAFRGGFPSKVRIPGAKYHVIGVTSTRGHEKQLAATVLK